MSDDFKVRYENIPTDEVCGRLIRNPGYGGPSVSLNGWRYKVSISNHTKALFQEALFRSIEESGVRNPILVWSLPEGTFLTFGGSRLRACQEIGIARIPAIINDYTDDYRFSPEVTPENWADFFTDPPRSFEFGEYGADYHYNLERARRQDYDPAGFAWVEGTPEFISQEFPWVLEED
ncbi:MAG: ParB N-terminal domain-containing protein [Nitrososphaerales archaeon]